MRAEAIRVGAQPPPPPSPPSTSEEGTRRRAQPQRRVVEGTLVTDLPEYSFRTPLDMDPDALSNDVFEEVLSNGLSGMAHSASPGKKPKAPRCDKPDAIKFGLGSQALSEFTLDAHEVTNDKLSVFFFLLLLLLLLLSEHFCCLFVCQGTAKLPGVLCGAEC